MSRFDPKFCPHCHAVARPKYRGTIWLTLFLLLFWVVPGLVYEWWRTRKGPCRCPVCGSCEMIPLHSPLVRAKLKEAAE